MGEKPRFKEQYLSSGFRHLFAGAQLLLDGFNAPVANDTVSFVSVAYSEPPFETECLQIQESHSGR